MQVIADGLLIATALVAALYCAVLSSRLRRLARSDDGIGGQIGTLSAAVDEAREALNSLQGQAATLRRETSAAGDRLRRESTEAKRLAETLAAATDEARRLMDALEQAPVPLPPQPAPPPVSRAETVAKPPEVPLEEIAEEVSPGATEAAPQHKVEALAEDVAPSADDRGGAAAMTAPEAAAQVSSPATRAAEEDRAAGEYRVVTDQDALAFLEAAVSATAERSGSRSTGEDPASGPAAAAATPETSDGPAAQAKPAVSAMAPAVSPVPPAAAPAASSVAASAFMEAPGADQALARPPSPPPLGSPAPGAGAPRQRLSAQRLAL
ncbi:MAG: hypothetical protein AAF577_09395 [Pseudomonadota bacterium]